MKINADFVCTRKGRLANDKIIHNISLKKKESNLKQPKKKLVRDHLNNEKVKHNFNNIASKKDVRTSQ